MQSRIRGCAFLCAVVFAVLSPRPLLSNGVTPADSLADFSRGELVAASLQSVKGDYQGAVDRYRKLLVTQPNNGALHYALSNAYLGLGIIDSARVHSEKSVQLDPDNKYYGKLLAGISHQMNNYRQAADRYRQLATLERGEGKARLLFTLGQLYFQTAQYDLAIQTFRELLRDNPEALPAWLALFESSVHSGNNLAFREDLLLFYSAAHASIDQRIELVRLFVVRSSKERAYIEPANLMIAAIHKHHPRNPRLAMTLYGLEGELLFQAGNTKEAVRLLERVVRSKNAKKEKRLYLQANSTLALCYDKLGYYEKCIRLYEGILRIEPENVLMMNNLAYILAGQGKALPRAKELVMKAITREPANASYLDTLGWVLFKMGMYEQARETLEKAVRLNSNEVEIYEHLSKVYEKIGNTQKALELLERAKQIR
jgi:tetratricopeptide (TPR) repeat protein